jgi:hypothetical protein
MDNYTKVSECFHNAKCQLLTSYEEFESRREALTKKSYQFVRVDFIGTCSHASSAVFTNFNLRKTGIICKACILQQSKSLKRPNCNQVELSGIKILEEYLTDYEVVRTKEGCRADLAIKRKTDSKWIPIQIKTTIKPIHTMYSFRRCNKDYNGMLLICICISEKKIWILPFSSKLSTSINISVRSKYNKYLVVNEKITESIEQYRDSITMTDLESLMIPVNPLQQREQEYAQKRETALPFLQFIYPELQGSVTDFICNGKKVQEKVLSLHRKSLMSTFATNNGKHDGKRQYKTYMLGENDYYWFHSSIDERFWIIPETVLFEKGYITELKSKKRYITISASQWDNYKYDYQNINQDNITTLFL